MIDVGYKLQSTVIIHLIIAKLTISFYRATIVFYECQTYLFLYILGYYKIKQKVLTEYN
ncbi:hypothetical protein AGMMS49546_02370 [Spirochaetia bacterium]|nr:hypothetical protein AGMMS49546_02370 [Spirochaetia bacterium]